MFSLLSSMSMKIMNGSQPEEVLDYQKNKAGQWEILISWEGLPRHEATWEAYDEMQRLYPDLRLEDKVNLERGSNVRHLLGFVIVEERNKSHTFHTCEVSS